MLDIFIRIKDHLVSASPSKFIKDIGVGLFTGCKSLLLDYVPNRYDRTKSLKIGQDWVTKFTTEKSLSPIRAGAMVPGAVVGFGLGQVLTIGAALPFGIYITCIAKYNPTYREIPLEVYRMSPNKKIFMFPALIVYSVSISVSSIIAAITQFLYLGLYSTGVALKSILYKMVKNDNLQLSEPRSPAVIVRAQEQLYISYLEPRHLGELAQDDDLRSSDSMVLQVAPRCRVSV